MTIIDITNIAQIPVTTLYIQLPGETVEQAAARLERQTGQPVTVWRLKTSHWFSVGKAQP